MCTYHWYLSTHTWSKDIAFIGDGDFFLIISIGEAEEIVLNRRRPFLINGRKSIGLTSIFDDIGDWKYFGFVFAFEFEFVSLHVEEIFEVGKDFRIIALSYTWLLTEQRTIGSGIVICVIVYRRFARCCSSSGRDCVFFNNNKLSQSDVEFEEWNLLELSYILFDKFVLFLIVIFGSWWKLIIKWS